MKNTSLLIPLLFSAAVSITSSQTHAGETGPTSAPEVSFQSPTSRWRFGAGYAPLIGLHTEFKGLGKFGNAFTPKPLGGGVDYEYEDGFVRVDGSGNLGGETWNWGYENQSQYNPANGGSMEFSLSNSEANGSAVEHNNAEAGVDIFTYYDMGAISIPGLKERGATWGFRGGLHYAHIDVENNESVSTNLTKLTDRFKLDGVTPPSAPYTGTFSGPGAIIGDSPTRIITTNGQAFVSGLRELEVHLTTFNVGGYLEIPVAPKFDVMIEAGVSAAIASGSYDFKSSTSVTGSGTQVSSGNDSGTSVLPGLYLGLGGTYQINKEWAIQAAGRYQYMDDFELGDNGSDAVLSFDSAFVLSIGALYSF